MTERYGTPDEENPEWTKKMLRNAKPGSEVFSPGLLAAHAAERRRRGKQKAPTKRLVSLRVAPEVLEAYRSKGKGWQVLMHDTLAAHAPRRGRVGRPVAKASSRAKQRTRAKH
jgi:uncharacterized protein (DUF4415 family)